MPHCTIEWDLTVVAWLANDLFYLLHSVLHVSTRVFLNICTHRLQQFINIHILHPFPFPLLLSCILPTTLCSTMDTPTRSIYPLPPPLPTFYYKQSHAHSIPSRMTLNIMTSVRTNVFRMNFQLIKIVENGVILFILGAKQTQTT